MRRIAAILSLVVAGCSSHADEPDAATSPDAGVDARPATDAFVCPASRGGFVSLVYVDPGTPTFDCALRDPTHDVVVRRALITGVSRTDGARLDLDFCSPAADCVPQPGSFLVTGGDVRFDWGMPITEGQFVEIHWRVRSPFGRGCTREIEIWNLPSWDGVPNPVRTDDGMFFAAADAVGTSMPGAPVTVAPTPIGCADPAPRCMGTREALALTFTTNGHVETAGQGASTVVDRDGIRGYVVTNVSSFVTGDCDDPGAFGWTVEEDWYEFP